jgi:hypothetical protein
MATPYDDFAVPQVIADLVIAQVSQVSPFIASGAAAVDTQTAFAGHFYQRARWREDLSHDVQIDGEAHAPVTLGMDSDFAPVCRRIRVRRTLDGTAAVTGLLSSSAPNAEVIAQTANYWAREIDDSLGAALTGLYDGSSGPLRVTHLKDVAVGTGVPVPISYGAVVKGASLAGDTITQMSLLVCHSRQWADLALEVGAKASFMTLGGALVPTLGNLRVWISDGCPTSGSGEFTKYTAFVVRPGALYVAMQQGITEFFAPVPTVGAWDLGQTMHYAPGIAGVKWNVVTTNPDNATLATPASWAKSGAIDKTIGIIAIRTNATP